MRKNKETLKQRFDELQTVLDMYQQELECVSAFIRTKDLMDEYKDFNANWYELRLKAAIKFRKEK